MDQSDVDDFNSVLSRHGYVYNDFQITETDYTKYDSSRIVPVNESVTVKRISTDIKKSYYSGDNSNWVADFENDLNSGVFKIEK